MTSLQALIAATPATTSRTEFIESFRVVYPTVRSDRMASSYVQNTLVRLGLVESHKGRVAWTTDATRLLSGSDPQAALASLLLKRVWAIDAILVKLNDEPLSIRHLHKHLVTSGFPWRTDWQLRYRLNWLESAGLVRNTTPAESSERYPQWALTSRGKRMARRLLRGACPPPALHGGAR